MACFKPFRDSNIGDTWKGGSFGCLLPSCAKLKSRTFDTSPDIILKMSNSNHPNNARLRELLDASELTMATAMTLFNRGRAAPITESVLKGWLAPNESPKWVQVPDDQLAHAEVVFARAKNN
jgi:hypothetical protein